LSQFTADDNALAQKFFQQAIDFDPTFGAGFTGLARAQFHAAARFQTNSLADTQSSTESLARQAVALDAADAEASSCLAAVLLRRGDHEGALAEAERALSMAPNLASAHGVLGASLMYSGRPREGLSLQMQENRPRSCHFLRNRLPHSPPLARRLNARTILHGQRYRVNTFGHSDPFDGRSSQQIGRNSSGKNTLRASGVRGTLLQQQRAQPGQPVGIEPARGREIVFR
jgi:tetratricopeptide (TPR) repeat protein